MTAAPVQPPEPVEAAPQAVNLDALRAARREGRGDALEVTNKGQTFRLPAELPADALEPLGRLAQLEDGAEEDTEALGVMREALEQGLAGLFCTACKAGQVPYTAEGYPHHLASAHDQACQWPRFLSTRPSLADELELWGALFGAYSVTLGEAWASLASSASDGTPSNPTSPGSTGSTPATPGAGKPKRPAKSGGRPSRR